MAKPDLPLDLLDPRFVADPYPYYAWLRANAPVAELAGGGFILTRHSDIKAALSDHRLGNAPSRFSALAPRNAEKYVAADLASHIAPFLDGDAHRPVRQMVSRAFFNTFKPFEASLETLAQEQILELGKGGDVIAGTAQPFALRSMMRFCGIEAEPEQMKQLTQAFFHLFAPLKDPEAFARVNGAMGEFRSLIEQVLRRGPRAGTLLAELRDFQMQMPVITPEQIIDNCLLVFADGVENIEAGAASILLRLERENRLADLRTGALDMESAIGEALRLDTPAQLVPRVAREAHQREEVKIGKDMPVFLALASGNRDGEVFDRPNAFNADRMNSGDVLTFGQGKHRCIGAPLALAQLKALTTALVAAGFRPDPSEPRYHARAGHRWPIAMNVKRG